MLIKLITTVLSKYISNKIMKHLNSLKNYQIININDHVIKIKEIKKQLLKKK